MKARDWQRVLERQRRDHAKTLFTATELANMARTSLAGVNVQLGRLASQGILTRYARGIYGLPTGVQPETLARTIDSAAYVTGAYALFRHNIITQVPNEITCFTNRRHNRSRVRQTPLGRFVFVCVSPQVYATPRGSGMADPVQALCDYAYLAGKQGRPLVGSVSFRKLDSITPEALQAITPRYPKRTMQSVQALLAGTSSGGSSGTAPSWEQT